MSVREEETVARVLEQARRELADCRERLQRAKRERLDYNERTCAESAAGVSGQRLLEKRAISEMIKRMIEMAERQSIILQEKVEKREAEWWAKRRARRVLENLRDRGLRKWRENFDREEQKMIDEIASNRFNWRRRQHGGVIRGIILLIVVTALGVAAWYGARIAGHRDIPLLSRPTGSLFPTKAETKGLDPSAAGVVVNATSEVGIGDSEEEYSLTSTELKRTFEAIREREEGLRSRALELDNWEKRLQKRQSDIDAEITECEDLRANVVKEIAELKKLQDWRDGEARKKKEADLASLTGLYEKSRPKEAARMIANLPTDRAQDVLINMKQGQAVKVLTELSKTNPKLANEYLQSISDNMEKVEEGSAR
jgi:flagellar export protein FliJ